MANRWTSYFVFSKKERIGILSLLALIVIIWFLPAFFRSKALDAAELELVTNDVAVFHRSRQMMADSLLAAAEKPDHEELPALFYFDPNRLDRGGWRQLGLPERTITTIENYRARGGRFFKPADFKKIFGLKPEEYDRLYPYIRIEAKAPEKADPALRTVRTNTEKPVGQDAAVIYPLDINAADTGDFRKLRGIGQVLSRRIVAFRQKLGGFYSVDQLAEVYGLPDSTFEQIRHHLECRAEAVEKININTADEVVLKDHPYIKYRLATAVIAYRKQHGVFGKPEDIKKLHLVTEEVFEKIAPYLVAE